MAEIPAQNELVSPCKNPYLFFALAPKQQAAVLKSRFQQIALHGDRVRVLDKIKQENPDIYNKLATKVLYDMTGGALPGLNKAQVAPSVMEAVKQGAYKTLERLSQSASRGAAKVGRFVNLGPFVDAALSWYLGKDLEEKVGGSVGNFAVGGLMLAAGAPAPPSPPWDWACSTSSKERTSATAH